MIGNVHEKEENYDLLTNVIICLGDAYDKEASGILRMLEVLLSDKRNASEKRMILQDDFGIVLQHFYLYCDYIGFRTLFI